MAKISATAFFNGAKAIPRHVSKFSGEVRAEARKVVWPTRQETVTTAIFVAVMMTLLSVFFLGIDTLFGSIVALLLKLS